MKESKNDDGIDKMCPFSLKKMLNGKKSLVDSGETKNSRIRLKLAMAGRNTFRYRRAPIVNKYSTIRRELRTTMHLNSQFSPASVQLPSLPRPSHFAVIQRNESVLQSKNATFKAFTLISPLCKRASASRRLHELVNAAGERNEYATIRTTTKWMNAVSIKIYDRR